MRHTISKTLAVTILMISGLATNAAAQTADPRVALKAGWRDAAIAASNMTLVSNTPRPRGFFNESNLGDILLANSDMAFRGNHLFLGSFHGFQIYDIADPQAPSLLTAFVCPGGQGDMSVYRNLLFMSVEMPNGRTDCTNGEMSPTPSPNRFLGVRVFDISDLKNPKQVAAVQTCRGSHTHTLVLGPKDTKRVYIYVQGTGQPRDPTELAGCVGRPPKDDPNTSLFRIEVIEVPVAAAERARIVNAPRIFADKHGNIAGLWPGGAHGQGTQSTAQTNHCHDITVYSDIGLAAGACSGNGILLDVSDPANPKRVREVIDPNFAYWHSATFNNAGNKVIYTDEWGSGMAARCQATDPRNWGANAIFDFTAGELKLASYYKLPAPQSAVENCVAHNGSLIPVPGRDIMVQAWYQGGISVFDFTDSKNPVEIAYFDRGPQHGTELQLGGHWGSYWYNGYIYASEIGRGLDILELTPSEHLTQNEIDAAKSVKVPFFNPQSQTRITWPANYTVARAYLDQLKRGNAVSAAEFARYSKELARIEKLKNTTARRTALNKLAGSLDDSPFRDAVRKLAVLGRRRAGESY